ncbi:MAG: glycosyl hydrolase 53 family protein [Anaerolineae bacterium]|nr:glycosyl hydrolase 53 family protein [Anaerolineae bacterium]
MAAALLLVGCRPQSDPAPAFYLGVDLSYVNEMDDCGAIYRENGAPRDAYALFRDHGANLVRARLWHNPGWTEYSTLPDVERTLTRARDAGMAAVLDFHYSDDWADPGKQGIPAAWKDLTEAELLDAVYQYTYDTLTGLHAKGLMPDFVQVGNETNAGMLKPVSELDWPRDAKLFNAGIRAVRDVAAATKTNPKIILHVAQPENAGWWFREARDHGITDFDVIGLSYYPQWSAFAVSDVGPHAAYLRQEFGKDVLIVETAYAWTLDAAEETADNILYQGVRGYPISLAGQRQFMIDLTQSLISNGALGVVYWEPAWVSTPCLTRWGQGSHWENATFFDFKNGNELHRGIEFLSYPYRFPVTFVDGVLEEAYGEPLLRDDAGDNLEQAPHLDLLGLHARDDAASLYLALMIAGDVYADPWGNILIYFDATRDGQGATVDVDKRPIAVADPYRPEFRLDITALDRKGTVSGSYAFYAWDGVEWQTRAMTGGVAIHAGTPSLIELQIPKSALGDPAFVNLGAVTTGRGRVHTAGDVLGTPVSPADWKDPVTLDIFARYAM